MLSCHGNRVLASRLGPGIRAKISISARSRVVLCFAAKGSTKESQVPLQKAAPSDSVAKDTVQAPVLDDPVVKNPNGWTEATDVLLEKGYVDKDILDSERFKEMQNSPGFDAQSVINNAVALGLIMHNSDDVKYLVRGEPNILLADLLAWSGLLQTLGVSINHVLDLRPRMLVSCKANSCLPTLNHLLHHSAKKDLKALGTKIKRYPGLLTIPESQLHAADAALVKVGLKPAPMRLMLAARPEIYLMYASQPEAFIVDLEAGCSLLKEHGLDPGDILSRAASVAACPHPGKRLKEKLDALSKLGLNTAEVGSIVSACPGALLLSAAQLHRKWAYLRVVLHGGKAELLEYPEFLLRQLSRDIAPALAYLVQKGEMHRVTGGGASVKVGLELLANEADRLRSDFSFQDFASKWKGDMRQ